MANYLNGVSFFDICQAHEQLEADYNSGGWLQERPSNARRRESTSCQLSRMNYSGGMRWVEICAPVSEDADDDEAVRMIYLEKVLVWDLPIDAEMMRAMRERFTEQFLAEFPQTAGEDYKQGR